jgi:hypothetical protein
MIELTTNFTFPSTSLHLAMRQAAFFREQRRMPGIVASPRFSRPHGGFLAAFHSLQLQLYKMSFPH